ncbi:uncharacterized protein PAC_03949 [Phialocephala subalpina]|uniref:Uncharacterized protein n=1 Tax=Phialocephala subalpina TaxID=576137 RepID=A0A1L7WMT8_9HELO|nr:uncharacterized protein PAC_03949 [Phialocephala subalpina]
MRMTCLPPREVAVSSPRTKIVVCYLGESSEQASPWRQRDEASTSDGTAGIRAEFECAFFYFTNSAGSKAETNAAKRQVVAGRTGTNFMLTADTGSTAGKLYAEYILNGQNIKVGSGDAARASAAAAWDLNKAGLNNVDVVNNNCNPWSIDALLKGSDPADVQWDAQVTAPMLLEALYILMKEQLAHQPGAIMNTLNGFETRRGNVDGNLIVVTQEYFQSNTNGIDASKVSDDVLGFCSLVYLMQKA